MIMGTWGHVPLGEGKFADRGDIQTFPDGLLYIINTNSQGSQVGGGSLIDIV